MAVNGEITKVEISYSGIRDILRSPEMEQLLHTMGEAVRDAVLSHQVLVQRGRDREVLNSVHVDSSIAGDRARCYVSIDHPAGLAIEAKYGVLTSSIDAARV